MITLPPELVADAKASGASPQSWESFALGWRREIAAAGGEEAGLLLREIHTKAYMDAYPEIDT